MLGAGLTVADKTERGLVFTGILTYVSQVTSCNVATEATATEKGAGDPLRSCEKGRDWAV